MNTVLDYVLDFGRLGVLLYAVHSLRVILTQVIKEKEDKQ